MDRLILVLLMVYAMISPVVMQVVADTEKQIGEANDIQMAGCIKINGQGKSEKSQEKPEQNSKIPTPRSCLDHLKNGETRAKVYTIMTPKGPQEVFCDLRSEPGSAWTLVLSHRMEYRNKDTIAPFKKPLTMNIPVNEKSPNYNMYRMTRDQMTNIKSQSTHWRVTCNGAFVDYRDYLRVRFADLDPLTFNGAGVCKKVEYINVRGHVGIEVTVPFWQMANRYILHHDSSARKCSFGASAGYVSSEDNFGFYGKINRKFRCSSSDYTTSNMWFGASL
ncbi:uncharacterized protein LOC116301872 isoform X2 [Actinia tenebrosa]|uniref:Uncharacterized protein LOC116301872 isoform X2 n=1 Tax=Actinia tenebrosa TaxID=6105 RepID=A0A6P8IJI1_ACTTE|nr:uncharacterized protein LOC116301872 isoform X2 [Actinia tenebrosa]